MIDPGLAGEAHFFTAVTGRSAIADLVLSGAWDGYMNTVAELSSIGPTSKGWQFADAGIDGPAPELIRTWIHDVVDMPDGPPRVVNPPRQTDTSLARLLTASEALRICDPHMELEETTVCVPSLRSLRRDPVNLLHNGSIVMRGLPVNGKPIDVDVVLRVERDLGEAERAATQAAMRYAVTLSEPPRLIDDFERLVVDRRPLGDRVEGDAPYLLVDRLGAHGLGVRLRARQWSVFVAAWLSAAIEAGAREADIFDELMITVRSA